MIWQPQADWQMRVENQGLPCHGNVVSAKLMPKLHSEAIGPDLEN